MMISELSYLHLQQSEEDRFAQELEWRREHLEREQETDASGRAAIAGPRR